MSTSNVLGRAWIYDDEPREIELWEHELVPMDGEARSGAEWCKEHLDCYNDKTLRDLLGVPAAGNFQVLFKGRIEGRWERCGLDGDEWDEEFILEESKWEPIPAAWLEIMLPPEEKDE